MLALWIYLSSVTEIASRWATFFSIATFVCGLVTIGLTIANAMNFTDTKKEWERRSPSLYPEAKSVVKSAYFEFKVGQLTLASIRRAFIWIFSISFLFSVFLPSQKTVVLIASAVYAEQFVNTVNASGVTDAGLEYVQKWIKTQVDELNKQK